MYFCVCFLACMFFFCLSVNVLFRLCHCINSAFIFSSLTNRPLPFHQFLLHLLSSNIFFLLFSLSLSLSLFFLWIYFFLTKKNFDSFDYTVCATFLRWLALKLLQLKKWSTTLLFYLIFVFISPMMFCFLFQINTSIICLLLHSEWECFHFLSIIFITLLR